MIGTIQINLRFLKVAKKFKIDLNATHVFLSFTKEYVLSILPESINKIICDHVFETCQDLITALRRFNNHIFDTEAPLYCPVCANPCKASCSSWSCPAKKVAVVNNTETQTVNVKIAVLGTQTYPSLCVASGTQTKKPLRCVMATQTVKFLPCVMATQTDAVEIVSLDEQVVSARSFDVESSVVKSKIAPSSVSLIQNIFS